MEKQAMNIIINWGLPLPLHFVEVIFSKLSISNLPTCRLVCKSWNHLILHYASDSSPKILPNAIICSTCDDKPYSTRPLKGFLNPKIHCFDIDTLSFVASRTIVGPEVEFILISHSCNGLLFITTNPLPTVGIFNPMTHEFFPIAVRSKSFNLFRGFGFSPKTKQYKLFQAYSGCTLNILRFGQNHNQWTTVYLSSPIKLASSGVYMNGVVYWVGKQNKKKNVIYALDVETEKFEVTFALEVGPYSQRAILQAFNATIYAIVFMKKPSQIQVWKMLGRDSWIRDFVVPGVFRDVSISLLKADGEKIFLRIRNNLICVDKSAGTIKKIKTLIPFERGFLTSSFSPIESLHFGSLDRILTGDELTRDE